MSPAPGSGGRGKRSRTPAPKGGARGGPKAKGSEAKAAWMKAKDASGGRAGRGTVPARGAQRSPVNDRGRGPGGATDGPVRRGPKQVGLGGDQVEGRQSVRELLSAGRRPVTSLLMAEGMDAAEILDDIEALATRRRVKVEYVSRKRLDAAAGWPAPR